MNKFAKYLKHEPPAVILGQNDTRVLAKPYIIDSVLQQLFDYAIERKDRELRVQRHSINLLKDYTIVDNRRDSCDHIHLIIDPVVNVFISPLIGQLADRAIQQMQQDKLRCVNIILNNYIDKSLLITRIIQLMNKPSIVICQQQADVSILSTILANYFQEVATKKSKQIQPILVVSNVQFSKLTIQDLGYYELAISIDQYASIDFNYNVHILSDPRYVNKSSITVNQEQYGVLSQPDIYKISLQCGYQIAKQRNISTINCIDYNKIINNTYFAQELMKYLKQLKYQNYVLVVNQLLLSTIAQSISFEQLFNGEFAKDSECLILVEFIYVDTDTIQRAFQCFKEITFIRVNYNQQQQYDVCLQLQLKLPSAKKQSIAKYKHLH